MQNLVAAGIGAFDVASPAEMAALRAVAPGAALHYPNPVRSPAENAAGVSARVDSYAVDCGREMAKLVPAPPAGSEMAVRFQLGVPGA